MTASNQQLGKDPAGREGSRNTDGKKGIQLIHGQGKADPGIYGSLSV